MGTIAILALTAIFGTFGTVIHNDQVFENQKAEQCADVNLYGTDKIVTDYCVAKGKQEQGAAELQDVNQQLEELNQFIKNEG